MNFGRLRSSVLTTVALALVTTALVVWAMARPRAAALSLAANPHETFAVTASSTAEVTPSVDKSPSASHTPSGGLVVLGDDYAVNAAWVTDLGKELGLNVTNLAERGEGYRSAPSTCGHSPCQNFQAAAAGLATIDPQLVVVEGGEADGEASLDSAVTSTIQAIKSTVPSAKVLVVTPLSSQFPRPYWITAHTQSVQKAAVAAGVGYVEVLALSAAASSYDANGNLTPEGSNSLVSAIVKAAR